MHFCTAMIAIANDDQQVAYRGPYDPVSWPEIEVLRTIHGDQAVREVHPFVRVEQTVKAERERLGLIYGAVVAEKVWVGRNSAMELDAAETDALPAGTMWLNPITREVKLVDEEATPEDEEEDLAPGKTMSAEHRAMLSRNAKKRPRNEKGQLLPANSIPDEPTPNL